MSRIWKTVCASLVLLGSLAASGSALQDPDIQKNFRGVGVEPTVMGPQELERFMRAEHEKWGNVVRDTGATVN